MCGRGTGDVVRRLSGEDAGFLHLEQPGQPMHVLAIAVVRRVTDGGSTPAPITLEWLHRHVARRLGELPVLRWRIVPVPMGLHHPVCVEDPDVDLARHLRRVTLPPPGSPVQLDQFCGELFETPLDRRRPLWELVLVDGLAGGRQALVMKFHHCLMDGTATLRFMARLCSADDSLPPAPPLPPGPVLIPPRRRLVRDALRDQARTVRQVPGLLRRSVRGGTAAGRLQRQRGMRLPRSPRDVPPTLLNAFGHRRVCIRTSLPLADVQLVTRTAGVSVNDVVLAVVAGAFRRYLAARGGLPARPLVAGVPVAFEPQDAPPRVAGNRFTSMAVPLATDVADPWQRLGTISAAASLAKEVLAVMGLELLPDWLEVVPPVLARRAARSHFRRRRARRDRVDLNATISNVRGPTRAWSLGPAVVEELHFAGPPNNGVGTVTCFFSYGPTFMVCVSAVADAIEDPGELSAALGRSLGELVTAARQHGAAAVGRVSSPVSEGGAMSSGTGCRQEQAQW